MFSRTAAVSNLLSYPPPRPPASNGWFGLLRSAESPDDVVRIVREYLAQWSPAAIANLAPALRPGKFFVPDDVMAYTVDLLRQQQFTMDPRTAPELHAMANFFGFASYRMSQLLADMDRDDEAAA